VIILKQIVFRNCRFYQSAMLATYRVNCSFMNVTRLMIFESPTERIAGENWESLTYCRCKMCSASAVCCVVCLRFSVVLTSIHSVYCYQKHYTGLNATRKTEVALLIVPPE
jgi:hypothetical protein